LFGSPPPYFEELDAIENIELKVVPAPTNPTIVEPSGAHFMEWLTKGVRSHRIITNDKNALVHSVCDTLYLVTPGIFRRYAQEHPHLAKIAKQDDLSDWKWIQKRFEEMKLHRKQESGLNIWMCEVTGPRKTRRLNGYLLKSHGGLLNELALNNPYLKLVKLGQSEDPPLSSGHTQ